MLLLGIGLPNTTTTTTTTRITTGHALLLLWHWVRTRRCWICGARRITRTTAESCASSHRWSPHGGIRGRVVALHGIAWSARSGGIRHIWCGIEAHGLARVARLGWITTGIGWWITTGGVCHGIGSQMRMCSRLRRIRRRVRRSSRSRGIRSGLAKASAERHRLTGGGGIRGLLLLMLTVLLRRISSSERCTGWRRVRVIGIVVSRALQSTANAENRRSAGLVICAVCYVDMSTLFYWAMGNGMVREND